MTSKLAKKGSRTRPALPELFHYLVVLLILLFSNSSWATNCGENLLTYSAVDATGSALGTRCVSYHFDAPDGFRFSWYGEGQVSEGAYRQIGGACSSPSICTSAFADITYISGNGESKAGPVGVSMVFVSEASAKPKTIRLEGALNETWSLVDNISYTPLPPPTECGPGLEKFEVRARGTTRLGPVVGVRCVKHFYNLIIWYGAGQWPQQSRYAHIGEATFYQGSPKSGNATAICDFSLGIPCNESQYRSLTFSPARPYKGWFVDGSWNEAWIVPGTYTKTICTNDCKREKAACDAAHEPHRNCGREYSKCIAACNATPSERKAYLSK